VPDPARRVAARRIPVSPVNHSALPVPLVFPAEFHPVSNLESFNSRSLVNIVGDKQRLSRRKDNNETLVAASVVVIREQLLDHTRPLDLDRAFSFRKQAR